MAPINSGVLHSFLVMIFVLKIISIYCVIYEVVNYKINKGQA